MTFFSWLKIKFPDFVQTLKNFVPAYFLTRVGNVVASWLVLSTPEQALGVRALPGTLWLYCHGASRQGGI